MERIEGGRAILKAFIIGCGRIAGMTNDGSYNNFTHAFEYMQNSSTKLVGCMDTDINKGILFSKKFKCEFYNNLHDGISRSNPDILSVCTPDETHFSVVNSIFKTKSNIKVIFLEKPACENETEFEKLVKLSRRESIEIIVNHSRRFSKNYQMISNDIKRGYFGDLVDATITYYGGWNHNGVHVIDTLNILFRDQIILKKITNSRESKYQNDLIIEGELGFYNMPGSILLKSFEQRYYQIFDFDFRFDSARLRIENFGDTIKTERKINNNIGENILISEPNEYNSKTVPISNAIKIITSSIIENNPNKLKGYRLEDIFKTMKTIWQAKKLNES